MKEVEKIVEVRPTAVPIMPTGELRIAVGGVGPPAWHQYSSLFSRIAGFYGVGESLLGFDGRQITSLLAESWEVSVDGVTFKLRSDVPFNHGWGTMNAHDVVATYQDTTQEGAKGSADYLLIDWIKEDLNNDFPPDSGSPGGVAKKGLAVSRVTGAPDLDELWQHKNLSGTGEASGVEELARGANLGSSAFSNQDYEFTIDFGRYGLEVYVDGTLELDVQGTFGDGKLGFYEFWQDTVTFKDLSIAAGSFTETQQVSFSQDVFAAHEGGSATVTVGIDADLEVDLTLPITFTDDPNDPPESGEYTITGLTNNTLTISADDNSEPDSASFTISTTADDETTDDEKVNLGIGSVPDGILAGADTTFVIAERRTPGQPDTLAVKPVFDGLALSWGRPTDAFDGLTTYNLRY